MYQRYLLIFLGLRNGRVGSYAGPAEWAALGSEGRLYFPAGMVAVGVV